MENNRANAGKKKLLEYYRRLFRTPENLNHYTPEDYERAEKRFLKFFVLGYESGTNKKPLKRTG